MTDPIFLSHIFLSSGRNDDQSRIEQGRAEGWKQASLEIALSLLRQKFGAIDEKTEASIGDLTQEQLRQLTDTLLKLESLDELRVWLETVKR